MNRAPLCFALSCVAALPLIACSPQAQPQAEASAKAMQAAMQLGTPPDGTLAPGAAPGHRGECALWDRVARAEGRMPW